MVPSGGAAPSLQDLASGGLDMVMASLPEAKALIEAGKLRPLMVIANNRQGAPFGNVPTSKEAVGIYSAIPAKDWAPQSSTKIQSQIAAQPAPALLNESTEAVVQTYSIIGKKGAADRGYIIAKNDKGRILARVQIEDLATLQAQDPIGRSVKFDHRDGINFAHRVTNL